MIVIPLSLSLSFSLCISFALGITLNSRQNTSSLSGLTYICYSVAAMTQLFLYSYGGNHVGESVSNILQFSRSSSLSSVPAVCLCVLLVCFHFVISI